MRAVLASASLVLLLLASSASAQVVGGTGCSNVNDPACSKSPNAPVGREAILGAIAESALPPRSQQSIPDPQS
jgi:hypothetical protein